MSQGTDAEVAIAGRLFRLGATYASAIPPAKAADGPRVPRRLVSFDPAFDWPGGLVVAELRPPVPGRKPRRLRMSGGVGAVGGGAGRGGMSTGDEVVIAGRAFTLGAVYAPRPGAGLGRPFKPCR